MQENYLFYKKGQLTNYFNYIKAEAEKEINEFSEEYILNVNEENLTKALIEKYFLMVPALKLDKIYQLEPEEVDIEVPFFQDPIIRKAFKQIKSRYTKGTKITIVIPFDGNPELFDFQPSTYLAKLPQGKVLGNELYLEYKSEYDKNTLKNEINSDIQLIQKYINYLKEDIDKFNSSLENYIRNLINARKSRLLQARNLAMSLEIPIKKRTDAPLTFPISIRKKIELPKPTTEKFEPEPTLSMEIYEEIIRMLQNMIIAMERSPKTFSKLKEEELRDFFLVVLNANFEGEAIGEVFNYKGKTDILIRHENSNVFIAECKFWRGKEAFLKTIDQLFKYVTWRDTKLAILIFNREGNLKTILEKIPKLVETHSLYKRNLEIEGETKFRYIFHIPNDPNREVILTIMVFDIPKS